MSESKTVAKPRAPKAPAKPKAPAQPKLAANESVTMWGSIRTDS